MTRAAYVCVLIHFEASSIITSALNREALLDDELFAVLECPTKLESIRPHLFVVVPPP